MTKPAVSASSASDELRADIVSRSRDFFRANAPAAFVPGKTPIPASGKVLTEEDLANLVDASLDMWLTAGRYTTMFEQALA